MDHSLGYVYESFPPGKMQLKGHTANNCPLCCITAFLHNATIESKKACLLYFKTNNALLSATKEATVRKEILLYIHLMVLQVTSNVLVS